MKRLLIAVASALLSTAALAPLPGASGGDSIATTELRAWLTYIASDELQGRGTYSAGLGLAASYIGTHLKDWGVEPAGDDLAGAAERSYLQTVRVLGVRSTSRSTLVVRVGGETRTFEDGKGVTFPKNAGAAQTVRADRVEFVGYGLDLAEVGHQDFGGKDVAGAAVVWLGSAGPKEVDQQRFRRLLAGRRRYATEQLHALASVGPGSQVDSNPATEPRPGRTEPDFVTVQPLDRPTPPSVTLSDEFFDFLFSRARTPYQELKRQAPRRARRCPSFRLDDVTMTFNVDVDYEVVRTQLTHNVVGDRRGHRSAAEEHLRRVRRALRSRRLRRGGARRRDASRRPPGRVTPGPRTIASGTAPTTTARGPWR